MERKVAYYWCTYLQMIAPIKIKHLLDEVKNPQDIFGKTDEQLLEKGFTKRERQIVQETYTLEPTIAEEYEKLKENGIRFVTIEEEEYPGLLKEIEDRPLGLFVKGKLPSQELPKIAIVGARACSNYGKECAEQFAKSLSQAGTQIVSGMAYGIDCCSQKAALETGSSYAVLGGGVDICYPKDNIGLYERLIQTGGVISEMRPQTKGLPILFPRRNRIISGICDAVIIIEARKKSGSLITAEFAAEQGRSVYAVPGSIFSGLSEGCHELIRNGATLLSSPEELLSELHLEVAAAKEQIGKELLTPIEQDIYRFIGKDPMPMEVILHKTGYPSGDLCGALFGMELKGYIIQEATGYRKTRLKPPAPRKKQATR